MKNFMSVISLFQISTSVFIQLNFWTEDHRIIEVGRCLWKTSTLVFCLKHSYLIWEQAVWHLEWSNLPRLPQPLFGQRRFFLLLQLSFASLQLVSITACTLAGQLREQHGFISSLSLSPHPDFRKRNAVTISLFMFSFLAKPSPVPSVSSHRTWAPKPYQHQGPLLDSIQFVSLSRTSGP